MEYPNTAREGECAVTSEHSAAHDANLRFRFRHHLHEQNQRRQRQPRRKSREFDARLLCLGADLAGCQFGGISALRETGHSTPRRDDFGHAGKRNHCQFFAGKLPLRPLAGMRQRDRQDPERNSHGEQMETNSQPSGTDDKRKQRYTRDCLRRWPQKQSTSRQDGCARRR